MDLKKFKPFLNKSNWCFLNSSIAFLYSIDFIREYILSEYNEDHYDFKIYKKKNESLEEIQGCEREFSGVETKYLEKLNLLKSLFEFLQKKTNEQDFEYYLKTEMVDNFRIRALEELRFNKYDICKNYEIVMGDAKEIIYNFLNYIFDCNYYLREKKINNMTKVSLYYYKNENGIRVSHKTLNEENFYHIHQVTNSIEDEFYFTQNIDDIENNNNFIYDDTDGKLEIFDTTDYIFYDDNLEIRPEKKVIYDKYQANDRNNVYIENQKGYVKNTKKANTEIYYKSVPLDFIIFEKNRSGSNSPDANTLPKIFFKEDHKFFETNYKLKALINNKPNSHFWIKVKIDNKWYEINDSNVNYEDSYIEPDDYKLWSHLVYEIDRNSTKKKINYSDKSIKSNSLKDKMIKKINPSLINLLINNNYNYFFLNQISLLK